MHIFYILLYCFLIIPKFVSFLGLPTVGSTHIILIIMAALPFSRRKLVFNKNLLVWIFFVVSFAVFGWFFSSEVSLLRYITGFLLTYYFLFILVLSDNQFRESHYSLRILKYINIINLVCLSITIFDCLLSWKQFRESYTVFRDLSNYGTFVALSSVINMFLFVWTEKRIYQRIFIFLFLLAIFTTLKKLFIQELLLLVLASYYFKWKWTRLVIYSICFLPVLLPIAMPLIENAREVYSRFLLKGAAGDIRGIMYYSAIDISCRFFPLGSGFGTFGSVPSVFQLVPFRLDLHENYYRYGLDVAGDNLQRLRNGQSSLFFDTFYPHILGETGMLGLIIWTKSYLLPVKRALKSSDVSVKFLVVGIIVVMLLEGFFLFSPEIPVFILFSANIPFLFINRNQ